MTDRFFSLRLNGTCQGAESIIDDLSIEVLNDREWETLELSIRFYPVEKIDSFS